MDNPTVRTILQRLPPLNALRYFMPLFASQPPFSKMSGLVPFRRNRLENWPVTTYIMAHRVLDRVPVLDMSAVGRGETLARAVVCDHTSHIQQLERSSRERHHSGWLTLHGVREGR